MNERDILANRWRLHNIDTERVKNEIWSCVIDTRQSPMPGEYREPTTFLSHEQIGELSAKLDEVENVYNDLLAEYSRLFGQKKK